MKEKNNIGTIVFIIFLFLAGGGLIWYATTGMNLNKNPETEENNEEQEQENNNENEENTEEEEEPEEEETETGEEETAEETEEEEETDSEPENTSSTSGDYTDFGIGSFEYFVEGGSMNFVWNVTKVTGTKDIEYTTQKTGNVLKITFKNVTRDSTLNYINGTCAEETCTFNLVENWAPTVKGVFAGEVSTYEFTLAEGRNFTLDFNTEGKITLLVK